MKRAVVIVVVILLALYAIGSAGKTKTDAGSPQTAATPASPQLGQPYTAGNWRYTILGAERAKEITGGVLKDTAKGEFVIVGVALENIGKSNFGISGHDFTLEDGAGVTYTNAFPTAAGPWSRAKGYESGVLAVSTGNMPPGVPSKWVLVYDVTPGAQGLALRLNQAKVRVPLS
jgi:hypothetical protein